MRIILTSRLLVWIGLFFLLSGCAGTSIPNSDLPIEDINACATSTDCTLVYEGICGGVTAINVTYSDKWMDHLKSESQKYPDIVCDLPSQPIDMFETKCIQGTCRALTNNERAYLEFTGKPTLNTPVNLLFHFKFSENTTNIQAEVKSIPNGLEFLSGNPEWQGNLNAGEDGTIQVAIVATRTGYYQVKGTVQFERYGQKTKLEDIVYVEVGSDGAFFGSKAPNNWENSNMAFPADEDRGLVESKLIIEPEPALGQEFSATYRVTPLVDLTANFIQMTMILPQDLTVVRVDFPPNGQNYRYPGQLSWQGPIGSGQTVEIKAFLKAQTFGWGNILGELSVQAGGVVDQAFADAIGYEIHIDKYRGYYIAIWP